MLSQRVDFGGARRTQDCAFLHIVNVAVGKRVRVGALKREHDLRHAVGIVLVSRRNTPEGIALNDQNITFDDVLSFVADVFFAGGLRLWTLVRDRDRCGNRLAVGNILVSRGGGNPGLFDDRADALIVTDLGRGRGTGGFGRRSGLIGIKRRIEQNGEFAQYASLGPVGLDQEIEEGLLDRSLGGDDHHRVFAVFVLAHREPQFGQMAGSGQPRPGERVARRQADQQIVDLAGSSGYDFDFGVERLVQERLDLNLAQT